MANSITISHPDINGGTPRVITADSVTVSGSKNNEVTPNANANGPVYAQTQSYENPRYALPGIMLNTGRTNELTYADVLTLYKASYSGSNPAVLTITYDDTTVLQNLSGTTTGINVVLESYNLRLNSRDSNKAYMPAINLVFIETK